jgi:hypothetical protein
LTVTSPSSSRRAAAALGLIPAHRITRAAGVGDDLDIAEWFNEPPPVDVGGRILAPDPELD